MAPIEIILTELALLKTINLTCISQSGKSNKFQHIKYQLQFLLKENLNTIKNLSFINNSTIIEVKWLFTESCCLRKHNFYVTQFL